jgi:cellulose synthase/poly-beta-1,6-N-acetylglucosamine synthase-like glycosyltransferase
MITTLLAALALLLWVYLAAARGGFCHAAERDGGGPLPEAWPSVIAVIPARDEAEGIGQTVRSLLLQDYPGSFSVILVHD